MDKKISLIIGASVGGALLVSLVGVSIVLANRPSSLIARAAANTISDAGRFEAVQVAKDVYNGGSIALSANLDEIANDDVAVKAKYYTDASKFKGAFEMTLLEDGEAVFRPRLIYNQDKVTFSCPEIVDGTYGVNIRNLEKNLEGSIFDPDEETDYSLTDEQYEYFLNLKNTLGRDSDLQNEYEKVLGRYSKLAVEKLLKYSDVNKSSETIKAGGEKIRCTVITVSLDEDGLSSVIQDLIDRANDDEELEDLIYRVASNGSYREDPDDIVDSFYDHLDDIEDSLDDLDDVDITLDFYITSSGRRLARLDCDFGIGDEGFEFSLVIGKNIARSKEISFSYVDKYSKDGLKATYTVKEDSSKLYKADVKLEKTRVRRQYWDYDWDYDRDDRSDPGYDEVIKTETSTLKIEWDRRDGDFELKYKEEYGDLTVKGNLLKKGDKYIFALSNIKRDGKAVPEIKSLELTVTIDRHDPAPNAPGRFTEITKMRERDFKHFKGDLEDGFEDIIDEYFD